jgi:signal peptidase I
MKQLKEILDWVKYIAAAVIFAVIVNSLVLVNAEVMSPSMESTIMTGSRIFGFRLAYSFNEPERFDVIVFKFPDDEASAPFLKRIIGLPNETVEIKDGKVYINGSDVPLDDSFVNEKPYGSFGPFTVPPDSYFVLGDNRNNSMDSKDWVNKFVTRDKILGKVFLEYFPTPQFIE